MKRMSPRTHNVLALICILAAILILAAALSVAYANAASFTLKQAQTADTTEQLVFWSDNETPGAAPVKVQPHACWWLRHQVATCDVNLTAVWFNRTRELTVEVKDVIFWQHGMLRVRPRITGIGIVG